MSIDIVPGTPGDYEDIIDFANYVFQIDFPQLLPKLYANHPETAAYHYLIKEEGRIRAMAVAYPNEFIIGGQVLRALGIGTVAVHPYHRSKGYMRIIMDKIMADAGKLGVDIAYLSGLRQRYEHWGFTRTGVKTSLDFNDKNAASAAREADNYRFPPLSEVSAEIMADVRLQHEARLIRARRDDFLEICRSFSSQPYAIIKDGNFSGYLCYNAKDRIVTEFCPYDPEQAASVAAAFYRLFVSNQEPIRILLAPDQPALLASLVRFAEKTTLEQSMNFNILRWQPVLTACLSALGSLGGHDGSLVADIGGERYRLALDGGKASVEPTGLPADVTCSRIEAPYRIFAPSAYHERLPLLPLPLFCSPCDGI